MNDIERADRDVRMRIPLFFMMAAAMMISALLNIGRPRSHSPLEIGTWAVMAAVMALNLTPLLLRRSARIKALLNDETTRQHRLVSVAAGFWVAVVSGIVMMVAASLTYVAPVDVARVVVTATLSTALIRFAILERRATR